MYRYYVALLLCLLCYISKGQQIYRTQGKPTSLTIIDGQLTAPRLKAPTSFSSSAPYFSDTGNIAVVGGVFYYNDGSGWVQTGGGASANAGYGLTASGSFLNVDTTIFLRKKDSSLYVSLHSLDTFKGNLHSMPFWGISNTDKSNWNEAYDNYPTGISFSPSTGDLDMTLRGGGTLTTNFDGRYYPAANPNGYISSFTEVDPLFTASAANGILSSDITNWNSKQASLNGTGFVKSTSGVISYDNSTYYLASNPSNYIPLTAISGTAPVSYNSGTGAISMLSANGSTNGYLRSIDWNTFNNKQAALNGTGFVKISGTTISYDNSTYLTGNQTITLSGAVTGSGATSISTTLASGVVGTVNLSATGTPSSSTYLRGDNTWATLPAFGSVTSVSVSSANGFGGSVATATSTPAISITTSVTGLLKGDGTGVSAATAGTDYVTASSTNTLTNKRWTPRDGSTTSSATPTINTDNVDQYRLTAQAVDITSFTTNLSGTPVEGQTLVISITGTAARAITWGSSFEASSIALPTTTVSTNMLSVLFVYNSVTSKWRCAGTW